MLGSDATSISMQFTFEDHEASQSALSRSALLARMHHQVDPGGCVPIPCDTRTWIAWLTDDPSRMTANDMELMLSVIMVQYSYSL
jgi:hypothetical protein